MCDGLCRRIVGILSVFLRDLRLSAGIDRLPVRDFLVALLLIYPNKVWERGGRGMKVVVVKSPKVLGGFLRLVFGIKKTNKT